MKVDVILGLQWGDEGKGKIVDALCEQYDIIARFQGGPNAGHTLEFDGQKHVLHTIPSGIFHPNIINIIGNGVLLDPFVFMCEVADIKAANHNPQTNLKISRKTHLIIPSHRAMDAALEHDKGAKKIGSTLKGIGPAYTDKIARHGLRVDDIFSPNFTEKYQHLKQMHVQQMNSLGFDYQNHSIDGMPFADYEQQWIKSLEFVKQFDIIPCEYYLNEALNAGKRVLAEGAQGTLLDVDFGSYPFVTSSNTTVAGVCAGLGVAPSRIGKVYGIFKAYCTRVGNGPFPSELNDTIGDQLRKQGHEFGATTGRPRRCGWLDIPALQYAVMLNGVTELIVTKIDVMDNFSTIHICEHYMLNGKPTNQFPMTEDFPLVTPIYKSFKGWQQPLNVASAYEQLPQALQDYVQYVESQMGIRVSMVSVGPDRVQTIYR